MKCSRGAASTRFLTTLVGLGLIWRLAICWLMPIPAEDGVNRLWMAERFAESNAPAALEEVFGPLLPLLMALPIRLGADPFVAGQVVLAIVGAFATIPIVRAGEHLLPGTGRCAGCLVAFAPLPVRYAAEVYGEPLFILLGACALLVGLRSHYWWLGAWAGAAFWARPEAVLLVVPFLLLRPRAASRALFGLLVGVVLLGAWRAVCGLGFDPMPKFGFNLPRSVFAAPRRLLTQAAMLPILFVEAFSIAGLLALLGLGKPLSRYKPLLWMLGLAFLIPILFLPRRRFLVSWLFALAPLGALGLTVLPPRLREPFLWLVIVASLALGLRGRSNTRLAEIDLGRHLAEVVAPDDRITGDMTRVLYYAGRRPLPPRRFSVNELARSAAGAKVVVLGAGEKRRGAAMAVFAKIEREFGHMKLPPGLQELVGRRGIWVLERR